MSPFHRGQATLTGWSWNERGRRERCIDKLNVHWNFRWKLLKHGIDLGCFLFSFAVSEGLYTAEYLRSRSRCTTGLMDHRSIHSAWIDESTWFLGLHEVLHVQLYRTAYGELLCASRLSKVLKGQTLWVHIFCSRKPSTAPGREGRVGSQSACSDSHPIECECRNCARQHLAKSRWKNTVIFYFPWCLSLSLSIVQSHNID